MVRGLMILVSVSVKQLKTIGCMNLDTDIVAKHNRFMERGCSQKCHLSNSLFIPAESQRRVSFLSFFLFLTLMNKEGSHQKYMLFFFPIICHFIASSSKFIIFFREKKNRGLSWENKEKGHLKEGGSKVSEVECKKTENIMKNKFKHEIET